MIRGRNWDDEMDSKYLQWLFSYIHYALCSGHERSSDSVLGSYSCMFEPCYGQPVVCMSKALYHNYSFRPRCIMGTGNAGKVTCLLWRRCREPHTTENRIWPNLVSKESWGFRPLYTCWKLTFFVIIILRVPLNQPDLVKIVMGI